MVKGPALSSKLKSSCSMRVTSKKYGIVELEFQHEELVKKEGLNKGNLSCEASPSLLIWIAPLYRDFLLPKD